jgi:hypothetical protein
MVPRPLEGHMIVIASRTILAVASAAAIATALFALQGPEVATGEAPPTGGVAAPVRADTIDHTAKLVRLANRTTPFRASRSVPGLRFGEQPPPPAPVPPPKPALVLNGIVWSATPAAVIEGFPGREGPVVLRRGESEGVFRVRRIERAVVEISGMDSTWVLRVRQPW